MKNQNMEVTENTEIDVVSNEDIAGVELVDQLNNPSAMMYCSIENDGSRKSQIEIYNAISGSDNKLADHINEVIEAVDIAAHPVTMTDEKTGEILTVLRTVIVDKKGVAYSAVSQGITNALSRIFAIVGKPSWKDEPVKMKIKQVQTRNDTNKVLTIELVK